jgi:hypothetical protein
VVKRFDAVIAPDRVSMPEMKKASLQSNPLIRWKDLINLRREVKRFDTLALSLGGRAAPADRKEAETPPW